MSCAYGFFANYKTGRTKNSCFVQSENGQKVEEGRSGLGEIKGMKSGD